MDKTRQPNNVRDSEPGHLKIGGNMRIGTVGTFQAGVTMTTGVVSKLINENAIEVVSVHGDHYLAQRGQFHKLPGQYYEGEENFEHAEQLRSKFGITVGPCQKAEFGYEEVKAAEGQLAQRIKTNQPIGYPIPMPQLKEHFEMSDIESITKSFRILEKNGELIVA
jgi:hypothetical protein